MLESIWDLAALKASGADIAIWRPYFAFLNEQSRPGFAWMLGADRATAERGFRDGTHMAFALRENTLGLTRQGETEAVALWDWNNHGTMTPRMGQNLFQTALRGTSPSYRLGFLAGMEARAAFLAQESRLQVRVQPPARTLTDLPFTTEFMGFVPEALTIPSEEAKRGRTLLEILGLHRIEKCVVDFPGKDVEAIRGALAHARCVGTEADTPFHRPPGTRAYLQGYDGRTLPFQVFLGNWILAGGMCFVVK